MSPNVEPGPRVASRRSTPVSGAPTKSLNVPVEHHVEGVAGIAFPEDDLARLETDALEVGGQLGEGDPVEPGEQRHARQDAGGLAGRDRAASHGSILRWPARGATRRMAIEP